MLSVYKKFKRLTTGVCIIVCISISSPQTSWGADAFFMPAPGQSVSLSDSVAPLLLKGLKIDPANPLQIEFIVDPGEHNYSEEEYEQQTTKLVKYFLAGLTTPEQNVWVNLSPYESNRIIDDQFGETDMGRTLLAQDYVLKQITASLFNPEETIGQTYWKEVYEQTLQQTGLSGIDTNTFHKVWIVPDIADVYEGDRSVMIVDSQMKLMLEEDYLSLDWSRQSKMGGEVENFERNNEDFQAVTDAIRSHILPLVAKEINQGQHFEQLQQIYQASILSTWFKQKLKQSLLAQIYADQSKTEGINYIDLYSIDKIYNQYVEALQQGVFDMIREEYDPALEEEVPKHYFSGGVDLAKLTGTINPVFVLRGLSFARKSYSRVKFYLKSFYPISKRISNVLVLNEDDDWSDSVKSNNNKLVQQSSTVQGVLLSDYTISDQREAEIISSAIKEELVKWHSYNLLHRELVLADVLQSNNIVVVETEEDVKVYFKVSINRSDSPFSNGSSNDTTESLLKTEVDTVVSVLKSFVNQYKNTEGSNIAETNTSSVGDDDNLGGIDFEDLVLNVHNEGEMIDFQFDPVLVAEIKADLKGLVPVMVDITPIHNLVQYLGGSAAEVTPESS